MVLQVGGGGPAVAAAAALQTAYGVMPTAMMSSHCHSPGDSTITGTSSIDSLRQRALQYAASLGCLPP